MHIKNSEASTSGTTDPLVPKKTQKKGPSSAQKKVVTFKKGTCSAIKKRSY